ncbi:MAG: hypothetical protein JHC95_06770 [Solirubrobacteraceae bacterium]|nr:hypothetical protein [Solirubrobacteraceae bacterium]
MTAARSWAANVWSADRAAVLVVGLAAVVIAVGVVSNLVGVVVGGVAVAGWTAWVADARPVRTRRSIAPPILIGAGFSVAALAVEANVAKVAAYVGGAAIAGTLLSSGLVRTEGLWDRLPGPSKDPADYR